MTAEIAILNKSAVALAADSKVTIGGAGGQKTYDTVNKVFTLSKVHPVGIMIFGNAEFMRHPWETIIKMYRRQKGYSSEETVKAWAMDFIRYMTEFGEIRSGDINENIRSILSSWFSQIEFTAFTIAQQYDIPIPSAGYNKLLTGLLKRKCADVGKAQPSLSDDEINQVIAEHGAAIAEAVFEAFGKDDKGKQNAALQFSLMALQRGSFSPQSSGFVIAGFGDRELFPSLVGYYTDGYVLQGKIKIEKTNDVSISREAPSTIAAFAQGEMVSRFMDGIDPTFSDYLQGMFQTALRDSCLAILDKYGTKRNQSAKVRRNIQRATDRRFAAIVRKAQEYRQSRFSSPIVRMVALLPKDELAHLAESLVALTSLKRRVSSDMETVGGPIDVATISKGDGFIWIKRKHYFRPELNPQFARNYMMDMELEKRRPNGSVPDGGGGPGGHDDGDEAGISDPSGATEADWGRAQETADEGPYT